jgi:hypothetical protein
MKAKHERLLAILKRLWAERETNSFDCPSHTTEDGDIYRADVVCYVKELHYDFVNRRGVLMMGEDSCTDMMGCIRLFQSIDQHVEGIVTVQTPPEGDRRDTSYRLVDGEWVAFDPAKPPKQD